MKRELCGRVASAGVGHRDVDRAGNRVVPNGNGKKPCAEAGREPRDQLLYGRDLPEVGDLRARQITVNHVGRRGPGVDQRLDERDPSRDGREERIRDGSRRDDLLEEESLRQLVGHGRSLSDRQPENFSIERGPDYVCSDPPLAESSLLRGLPLAVLTVSLVTVPVLVLEPQGIPRMRSLEKELAGVQAENAELRRDVGKLRTEVKDLREDPQAVERIAREQLGLVRKSEVVFQFDKR